MASEDNKPDESRPDEATGADAAQYGPALHRFLMRRLNNAEDARDLAQEAYVRFLRLPQDRVVRRPRAYIFRIALNLVYEFILGRDRNTIPYDPEIAERQGEEFDCTDPGERLANEEQLNLVLMRIPPAYRRVLLLHRRDGLSYQEIADRVGISKQSVRKYLARAVYYGRRAGWDR